MVFIVLSALAKSTMYIDRVHVWFGNNKPAYQSFMAVPCNSGSMYAVGSCFESNEPGRGSLTHSILTVLIKSLLHKNDV